MLITALGKPFEISSSACFDASFASFVNGIAANDKGYSDRQLHMQDFQLLSYYLQGTLLLALH